MQTPSELKEQLQLGSSVMNECWSYKTKSWVSCIDVKDIDDDGEPEIIIGSHDGRVHLLADQGEDHWEDRWQRVVGYKAGYKAWIGSVLAVSSVKNAEHYISILVGTQDGKVYALDKDGNTLDRNRQIVSTVDEHGFAINLEQDTEAYWHNSDYEIRWLSADLSRSSQVVIDSEDHAIYTFDYKIGKAGWKFDIDGWVSAVFCCDINGDGKVETLLGTSDQHLYILGEHGEVLDKRDVEGQIHAIYAADINHDERMEILLGIDKKTLRLMSLDLETQLWRQQFPNGFQAYCIADINGDGCNEIVVGSEDKLLYVLDENGKELWRHPMNCRISSLYAYDVDGDGQVEVLMGSADNKENRLRVLQIRLVPGLYQKIHATYADMGRPSFNSLAGLTQNERLLLQALVTGTRPSRSVTLEQIERAVKSKRAGKATLTDSKVTLADAVRLDMQRLQTRWRSNSLGPITTVCLGDIYADPRLEIIAGTENGKIYAYNTAGKDVGAFSPGGEVIGVETAYFSGGKWTEIIIGSTDHRLYVYSVSSQAGNTAKRLFLKSQERRNVYIEERLYALCVNTSEKTRVLDIIISTEDKHMYIYDGQLTAPVKKIDTPHVINVLAARLPDDDRSLAIVAGSIEKDVYAYDRKGKQLWQSRTWGSVEALCLKDIDGDGAVEIIVGAKDRNVRVLNEKGDQKWRYYLPDSVLSVGAFDIDGDGRIEVLAACNDDYLYVFNRDGDLLWKYQAQKQIRVVKVDDIDGDNKVELVLGLEDNLEVLDLVDHRYLRDLIEQCWQGVQRLAPQLRLSDLLHESSSSLRIFALHRLAAQTHMQADEFEALETLIRDGSIEVRRALIHTIMHHYDSYAEQAQTYLNQIARDQETEVRMTLVKEIADFIKRDMKKNWDSGFKLLQRAVEKSDRFVMRTLMRELYHLIADFYQRPFSKRAIFAMLTIGLCYKTSKWVREEAARTLAYFLDLYNGDMFLYLHVLLAKKVEVDILRCIGRYAKNYLVRHIFEDLANMAEGLEEVSEAEDAEHIATTALTNLEQSIKTLEETRGMRYGEEMLLIYHEMYNLLSIRTVFEIAAYNCTLRDNRFTSNEYYHIALHVFRQLESVSRAAQRYLSRVGVRDRISCLLDANKSIDRWLTFLEAEYRNLILEESITNLPDHALFQIVGRRWKALIETELQSLSGKPELRSELETQQVHMEERIVVCLKLRNAGNSAAYNVHIDLLNGDQFEVTNRIPEIETLFPQDEVGIEFTIRLLNDAFSLGLEFEVDYREGEDGNQKKTTFAHEMQLVSAEQRPFSSINNPYSTGLPKKDMCYGRDDDLDILSNNLVNTRSLQILYGQRRSGKTTVLLQLAQTEKLRPHIPCFIDLQEATYNTNSGKLFSHIAYAISKALKARGMRVTPPDQEQFAKNDTLTLNGFLDDVEELLEERKLIILIDEFEMLETRVKDNSLKADVFHYLRSLVQHRQKIAFLFCGVNAYALAKEYWSPFFQIANHHRLSKLKKDAAEALITQPVKGRLEYEPFAIKKIRHLTADQPYLIHMVCRLLVEYCNDHKKWHITTNDVNTVIEEIIADNQPHFNWLWDESSQEERHLLVLMAEEGGPDEHALSLPELTQRYRQHFLAFKREHVQEALQSLIERDLVEKLSETSPADDMVSEDRYRIMVGLIRRWLQKNYPARDALHE